MILFLNKYIYEIIHQLIISMTSEIKENVRISKLEKRVIKLEKILLEKEDILHKNFDGYEIPTEEEAELIKAAEEDMMNKTAKTLDEILNNLE